MSEAAAVATLQSQRDKALNALAQSNAWLVAANVREQEYRDRITELESLLMGVTGADTTAEATSIAKAVRIGMVTQTQERLTRIEQRLGIEEE